MKSNRIGLVTIALEAITETVPASETSEVAAASVAETAPVAEAPVVAATATPEVPAGGNQDEVPADATATPPATESTEVVQAVEEAAAAAAEEPAPPVDEMEEVDLIEIFQDVGQLKVDGIELDSNASDLAEACAAVDELDDLANSAEETGAVDQDTDSARVMLEVAVEGIYNRLGIENPCIALEDAGGMGASVKEKVNSIREQVLRLLRTILDAIKKAFERAQGYFRQVFGVAGQIEKAAIAMRGNVAKLNGMAPNEERLSNQRLKSLIGVPKNYPLVRAFGNLSDLVQDAYKSANSGYIDYLNQIIDGFVKDQNVERLMNDFPRVLQRSLDERFSHDSSNAAFDVKGASANVEVLTSELLPGSRVGVLRLPKTLQALREFEYSIEPTDDRELDDLYSLNEDELKWLLDTVIEITTKIRLFEKHAKAHGSLVNHLSAAISNLEKKADVNITPEDREFLKSLSAMAPVLARGIHERTFAYAVEVCGNAVRYADLCVKSHKTGKADTAQGHMTATA